MSDLTLRTADLVRRVDAQDDDIKFICRELRWLRRGMTAMLRHLGLAEPDDEEE